MTANSETPVSSGVAADGAVHRWCWHCEQYTWQVPRRPRQAHPASPRSYKAWRCERCQRETEEACPR